MYRYKAEALIGLGDVVTAKEILEKAVNETVDDAACYFLLGLLEMGEEREKAEAHFLKALEMKKAFPEAHYYLGMLYLGGQANAPGLRALEAAKHYALLCDENEHVMGSQGKMHELIASIDAEVAHYEGDQQ